jgi:hypothetical protein
MLVALAVGGVRARRLVIAAEERARIKAFLKEVEDGA